MGYALQMTWQASLLSQKRKSGPPLGLKNLGNTCYLNSVLQCLTYTPPLAHFCLKFLHSSSCDKAKVSVAEKKSECPFCIVEKRIARSLSIEAALDSPIKINNCLKIFAEHFRHGRQEDAHEFLRYVIDACHNTCLRIKKLQQRRKGGGVENGNGNGHTVVKEIFGGALQSQMKCLSCGAESNKVDEIMDISLDVLHSGSLKEALQRFFQPEVLDGNNKYKCENCKKLVAARKQMSILQAPNVLAIQLKRFEGIFGGKIDKPIAFEEFLVLSSYMCRASQDRDPEYNLFATIVHSGVSADSGHYYAYIKDAMGRWYCCNDSFVSLSTLQEILSEKVYILFFCRNKQRPVPSRQVLTANGTKSHESNGNLTSKFPISGCLEKPVATQQFSDHHSQIVNSSTSKANKAPSSPPKKLSISENSNFERPPIAAAGNIKILVHKRGSLEKNGNLVHTETKEKTIRSVVDRNGVRKNEPGDAIDAGMKKSLSLANGNGKMHSISTDTLVGHICEDNERSKIVPSSSPRKNGHLVHTETKEDTICSVVDRIGVSKNESGDAIDAGMKKSSSLANGNCEMHSTTTDILVGHLCEDKEGSKIVPASSAKKELANGGVRCSSDKSGLKRKFQDEDRCILLEKDAKSRAEVEEFKEIIGKEAYLFLQSCGWSDKVYNFMQSKKKLCTEGAEGYVLNGHELKRSLIADAKSTFISRIPEFLKGSLIERLKSFSQEKQSSIT